MTSLHDMIKKLCLLALASTALSGCSTIFSVGDSAEFSCPGMPGVICKTPGQVYSSSNSPLPPNSSANDVIPDVKNTNNNFASANGQAQKQMSHVFMQPNMLQPVTGAPMPLREPSRVLRIWIAPWIEATTDNLHWPTYIYTEVQPRTWTIGEQEFKSMRPSMPLTVRQNIAQVPVANVAGGNDSGQTPSSRLPAPPSFSDSTSSPQPYD